MYRQVVKVLQILHFEPFLDELSLRSDVISSIQILSLVAGSFYTVEFEGFVGSNI